MTRQLLFYDNVTPISKQRHADWSIDSGRGRFEFARNVNSVPLMATEIPRAASDYTVVFAGRDDAIMPVVILGIDGDTNLYVEEDGGWKARYIPAFVRRYPFVFSRSEDGKTFTLCLDESWDGCNQDGRGERLFDDEGERTEYLQNVLNFVNEYQNQFRLTEAYCNRLKELDLLEPMQAQFTLAGGEKRSLTGFMAVNRKKLKQLPADDLSGLAQSDELELIYNHMHSMNHFAEMLKLAVEQKEGVKDEKTEEKEEKGD